MILKEEVIFAKGENPRAWTASGFEVCSSNLAAARFNMEKENPRKDTEFVPEEDTSSFRMNGMQVEERRRPQKKKKKTREGRALKLRMEEVTFDPALIQAIFKHIWTRRALEREKNEGNDGTDCEVGTGTLKKTRTTSANSNALKLSCELLRIFITEAVQRSAMIAEAEGAGKIEGTHLERILPQLLLDF
ncbi:hypothetical protein NC653_029500 [Populus alba x Populus x berolinensis]|nr:hypothetical protein NC653_029500 [Populus alba x Populus x berolinensis]